MQPKAQISTFTEYYSSFNNSGAMNIGVPIYLVFLISFSSDLTSPKSHNMYFVVLLSNFTTILSGLKSL